MKKILKEKTKELIQFSTNEFFRMLKFPIFENDIEHPALLFDWCDEEKEPFPKGWEDGTVGWYDRTQNTIKILVYEGVTEHLLARLVMHELCHWKNYKFYLHGLGFKRVYVEAASQCFGYNGLDITREGESKILEWEAPFISFLDKVYYNNAKNSRSESTPKNQHSSYTRG